LYTNSEVAEESAVVVMPGYAFHFETLKAVNPALSTNHAAALGAMGPDIFRYLPPSPSLVAALGPGGALTGQNLALFQKAAANPASLTPAEEAALLALGPTIIPAVLELWAKPIGTTYSLLFGPAGLDVATNWPILANATAVLAALAPIVQSQNEIALAEQISNVESAMNSLSQLSSIATNLQKLMTQVGFLPALGPWMEEPALGQLTAIDPSLGTLPAQSDQAGCRLYEFLRWHRAGQFASNLTKLAKTAPQKAFAQGWTCHYAASVTAEPFVNNIAGGPYRTHWWRNMLVQNFVDSWIFGFAETPATMSGDDPTPAYGSWGSLCSANLQDRFNAGGLTVPAPTAGVPAAVTAMITGNIPALNAPALREISDLFDEALRVTYPPAQLPGIGASSLPSVGVGFSAGILEAAFVGAFAVYWFLTSGTGPFGNNELGTPPSGCGTTAPSFITSGTSPTPSQAGLNTAGAVCAAVLIILALLALLFGDAAGALAALAAAMAAPVVNWDTVACNLFWANNTLLTSENALRDALIYLGLAYPPPLLLGGADVNGNTQPATDLSPDPNLQQTPAPPSGNIAPTQGVPLTRSNSLRSDGKTYPAFLDESVQGLADLNFGVYPFVANVQTETLPTSDLIASGLYAGSVFNGPVANGGVTGAAGSTYPSLDERLGGAVANAIQALASRDTLPDYNLDADRGYGWLTWHPATGSDPTSLPVQDRQDT
jgi:hypothetical protein